MKKYRKNLKIKEQGIKLIVIFVAEKKGSNRIIVMETKIKEKYETPVLQVVALKMEGIICESVMSAGISDLNDFLPDPTNPFGGATLSSTNPFASGNPFGFPTF